ncbi:MAG TPA: hypothetical protein H9856_04270 [Candidatus Limosilactobacillus merdigallinarum]|uniref:Uncharacterized protein n=1 Tax=Candidatus Limosilactobacillus merdigallinarum TaxID=2838652 RepID=A0A9D2AKA6_9LACO|nr:hypothetical protein [Candidatus Limosilactobacillus merdigallinarum]
MAEKRMFSNSVVWTDSFLELSNEAKLLYIYFGMQADDCGFVDNSKMIARTLAIKDPDKIIQRLIEKGLVIKFNDGRLLLIADWNVNNYIHRYRAKSKYLTKLKKLYMTEDGQYTSAETNQLAFDYFQDSKGKTTEKSDEPDWLKNIGSRSKKHV